MSFSTTIPPCCCGNEIKSLKDLPRTSNNLDASFVHLESESLPLTILNQAETLLRVSQGKAVEEGIWLCDDCLERTARAMEADNERLEQESQAYECQLRIRQEQLRVLEKTLTNNLFPPSLEEEQEDMITRIENAFEDEVFALQHAIAQQEEELEYLKKAIREQDEISRHQEELESREAHNENALELEARAMAHVQKQLTTTLQAAQHEIDVLASADLSLFKLVIDKRGLRYPLINELRLGFSPKGDLGWDEIQAAWGQVAQLLLFMDLQQKDWRIIPLTSCAKLIHEKRVFNLGKDMESMSYGLKALAALLRSTSHSLPFPITADRIGDVAIVQLPHYADHPLWSRVVHYLVCDLQYLAETVAQERRNKLKALLL